MTLNSNVILDAVTKQKLLENQLDTSGLLLVALADHLAQSFVGCSVYLGAVQDGAQAPALFAEWIGAETGRLLGESKLHKLNFAVSYRPQDAQSPIELGAAALRMQQAITKLPNGEGELTCHGTKTEITAGLAKLTGQVVLYEQGTDNNPIIESKELYV